MKPFRVVSFDPGITKMGVAVLDFYLTEKDFTVTEVLRTTLSGDSLMRTRKHMYDRFIKQYIKQDAMEEQIASIIDEYRPDAVASEGAFAYKHPAAIISLTLIIGAIRRHTHRVLDQDVHIMSPTFVKMAFSGTGEAGKPEMRATYENHPKITRLEGKASEHEIDAVAHGCAMVLRDVLKTVKEGEKKKKPKKPKK